MGRALVALVVCVGCDYVFNVQHVPPGGPDALGDAPPDAVPSCWSLTPANYLPCESGFPTSLGSGEFAITKSLDTSGLQTYGSGVVLLHYDEVTVEAGITLTITGTNPVVIVADGPIRVLGTIIVGTTTTVDQMCSKTVDQNPVAMNWSPGGGGGGYGDLGAAGGPQGGGINGPPKLVPLRGGCPGGRSGDAMGAMNHLIAAGVPGGLAGGALELSSKVSVDVLAGGGVFADGGGGAGGVATTAAGDANCLKYGGNMAGHDCDSGGGGGGAGGSLLLEGVDVTIAGTVCAVGGGAGAGGKAAGISGSNGSPASGCVPGAGGLTGTPGGTGEGTSPAVAGMSGGSFTSGGGGGGSVGRIRLHSLNSPTTNTSLVPSPTVD